MTSEQAQATYTELLKKNGFTDSGRTLYDGTTIYERCWTKGIEIAFYGHSKEHYRIEAWINGYCPMVRVIKNDRVEGNPRDYSSPKRAINAIAEIARCAGYIL